MARPATNHEAKKAQIAQTALKVFARHGFAGTSYRLIAQESKELGGESVSPSLIYHYFPEGKEQLFVESVQQLPSFQRFEQALKANNHEPPEVFLRIVTKTYYEFLKTPELLPTLRLILVESVNHEELLHTILIKFVPTLLVPMLEYFERQVAVGKVRPMKFDQLIMQMIGPIVVRRLVTGVFPVQDLPIELSSDEEYIESLVQTLLKGILMSA